ncbi:LOW QUALITY PROTEIN: zf-CCHC domain-containing protein/MP domain-containing protein, partial [Cephalotus follicularis]
GLNTSILACFRDVRHLNFDDSLIRVIEISLCNELVYFDRYPDLTISLTDKNILKTLKINIKLHGYNMLPGSEIIVIIHYVHYKATNSICLKSLVNLSKDDSQNSQNDFQEINELISPTYSEMKPLSQLMTIIIDEIFEINKNLIRKDFLQEKYLRKRHKFFQKYSEDEQNNIRTAWYEYMIKIKAHIMFFDYLPIYKNQQENKKYFTEEKIQKIFMNQKTTTTWLTSNNKIIEVIHPPSEKIQINIQNNQIQAAPFKLQNETSSNQTTQETNKIIEQNNYTNRHLQTLGSQLSRIENIIQDKIQHSREETKNPYQKIKPLFTPYKIYKDTLMTKVLTREDANQPYWKEKFITGLPTLFVKKIKNKYREKHKGIVPYEKLTYGDIVSTITKTGLEICYDIKMSKQIKKDSKTYKKELGDFCTQFGYETFKPPPSKNLPKPKIDRKNSICYNCGKTGHIAKYCYIRKQIKKLELTEDHKNQIFKIIDNQSPEEGESDYFSTSSTKIQAIKNSSSESEFSSNNSKIKTCNCNNCIIGTTCDKIDNSELKLEYLLKLKDLITNEPSISISQPYTLQKIFQRFEDSSKQNITLQDLQKEIKDTKQELQKFKQKTKKQITNLEQILLQKHSSSSSSDKEIEQIDQGETSTKFINLIEKITYQKWHVNINITIQDSFKLQTIALIDSGAQMNCIQEGLIPTKYFEKTKQKLSTANGENLRVNFKVTNVHICNDGICIKQSFILVKDLDIVIILGQPFLEIIKPFKVTNEGITTKLFQQKIIKLILKNNIIKNLCSDLPDAFWHRKRHMVSLPYEKDFTEQNIPTKSRPIQMSYELMEHCKKEIQELLNK